MGKVAICIALLAALAAGSARAASLESVGNFSGPIYVTSDPGNPDRLFIVERGGTIQVLEGGAIRPFATLDSLIGTASEGGLLSVALALDFDSSGRLFVYYTGKEQSPPEIHVAELVSNGTGAPISTLRNLLTIPHPGHTNHYGGQLQFGPEGNLFVGTGDGGGAGDPEENAQDLGSRLGKILRLSPNPSSMLPYTVPDNPFVGTSGADPLVWSYGLRNPFRFSFDRLGGDLWIGDVGQDQREEIDFAAAPGLGGGDNYGWNCREGSLEETVTPEAGCTGKTDFTDPVFDYPNPAKPGLPCAAVIGGYVARGPGLGGLYGRYVYGDLCDAEIRSFSLANPPLTDRGEGIAVNELNSFGQDSCGRLYAVSGAGPVYRIRGSEPASCSTATPAATLATSYVGLRPIRRKVVRNRRALITAFVSPCKGRQGDPVTLWRGRFKLGTRHFDRVCTARFRPRINRRTGFRATVKADDTYAAAISRKVTIKLKKRHPRRGKR